MMTVMDYNPLNTIIHEFVVMNKCGKEEALDFSLAKKQIKTL